MKKMTTTFAAGAMAAALLVGGVACGSSDDDAESTTTTEASGSSDSSANLTAIEERGKPTLEPAEIPTELVIIDDVEGTGAEVQAGDTVTVHYVGVAATTGEEFDSSWERGEPATFPLDGVIQGWGEGLVGMKEGGRRTLVIPAELGYGNSGPAPGDALVFTVDLVEVG